MAKEDLYQRYIVIHVVIRANVSILGNLPTERKPHGAEKKSRILVGSRRGVKSNMATWDHFFRVPVDDGQT